MKILITLLIILIPFTCHARGMFMSCGGNVEAAEPPAACETQVAPTDMETYYASSVFNISSTSALKYTASKFTAGKTTSICKACVYVKNSTGGTTNFSVTPYIYSNNTTPDPDVPDAVVGTFETKDMATILTDEWQWLCFNHGGTAPAITETYIYYFVLVGSSSDGTDIMYAGKDSTCTTEYSFRSADGATWTPLDTDKCMMLQLYEE